MERVSVGTIGLVALIVMMASFPVTPVDAATYRYDRQAAVNYALANWNKDVPGSWCFKYKGGDCTNFVSWSLYQGGWTIRGAQYGTAYKWYFYNTFWHSKGWTCVKEFGEFAQYRGYKIYLGSDGNTVKSRLAWYIQRGEIQKGDIIQRIEGKYPGHTMIITGVAGNTVFVTYHTPNTYYENFRYFVDLYPNAAYVVYHLLDSFGY